MKTVWAVISFLMINPHCTAVIIAGRSLADGGSYPLFLATQMYNEVHDSECFNDTLDRLERAPCQRLHASHAILLHLGHLRPVHVPWRQIRRSYQWVQEFYRLWPKLSASLLHLDWRRLEHDHVRLQPDPTQLHIRWDMWQCNGPSLLYCSYSACYLCHAEPLYSRDHLVVLKTLSGHRRSSTAIPSWLHSDSKHLDKVHELKCLS